MVDRADETTRLLGSLGAEAMRVLWSAEGPLTVRTVLVRLNEGREEPLAYTTVMTVLSRLAQRGAASRSRVGRGYVYEAAVRDAAQLAVDDLLRNHGEVAVAHFVERAEADAELRQRLARLLSVDRGRDTS